MQSTVDYLHHHQRVYHHAIICTRKYRATVNRNPPSEKSKNIRRIPTKRPCSSDQSRSSIHPVYRHSLRYRTRRSRSHQLTRSRNHMSQSHVDLKISSSGKKERPKREQTVTHPDHTLAHCFPPDQRDEALVDFRLWQICGANDLPDCKKRGD
jgi:hypothetical protein